jgi:hypothetical protein
VVKNIYIYNKKNMASINIKIKGCGLTSHETGNLPTGDIVDGLIVFDKSQGIPLYHRDGH